MSERRDCCKDSLKEDPGAVIGSLRVRSAGAGGDRSGGANSDFAGIDEFVLGFPNIVGWLGDVLLADVDVAPDLAAGGVGAGGNTRGD